MRPSRVVSVLVCVLGFAGCTSWRPVETSPLVALETRGRSPMRITVAEGPRLVVRRPEVRLGTVFGTVERCEERADPRVWVCPRVTGNVPIARIDQVQLVEVREGHVARSVVAGVVLALFITGVVMWGETCSGASSASYVC